MSVTRSQSVSQSVTESVSQSVRRAPPPLPPPPPPPVTQLAHSERERRTNVWLMINALAGGGVGFSRGGPTNGRTDGRTEGRRGRIGDLLRSPLFPSLPPATLKNEEGNKGGCDAKKRREGRGAAKSHHSISARFSQTPPPSSPPLPFTLRR